ncbi:hypothetical protein L3Y34_012784 [Caenorhabditis briggsae]|uniref:Uncharacterized protein n=2 Tax=Caenorhabditis briggsae TaxID=6238 RepID=A0AAE8ZZJ9_CAEBR|nr:hypothetical protein L3Y34_012784 [Caenorhabditis briggsae]
MTLCKGSNRTLCESAYGLISEKKSEMMDIYLFGSIEPETMAIYIIHNNEYHDGYTCEQLGHLIRIMRARTSLLDHKYDSDSIIKKTEQIIEKYNYQKRLKNDTLYQYERAALAKPPIGPTKQVEELPKIQNVSDPVAFLGIAEMVGIGSSTPKSDKIKKKVGPKDDSKDAPKILLPEILIEQLSPPTSPQSKT